MVAAVEALLTEYEPMTQSVGEVELADTSMAVKVDPIWTF